MPVSDDHDEGPGEHREGEQNEECTDEPAQHEVERADALVVGREQPTVEADRAAACQPS